MSQNTKQIRVRLKGDNIHKFTELKGRLKCSTNEETVNQIVNDLHRKVNGNNGSK